MVSKFFNYSKISMIVILLVFGGMNVNAQAPVKDYKKELAKKERELKKEREKIIWKI